jgi:transcriptional regulator with XRE-family HTH domain
MPKSAEPRPVGRPSEYDPAFCERVIALGKEGKSRAEIASALDCSRTTLASWERNHPEFLNALQRANDESLAWWEKKARLGIDKGSAFNSTLWAKSVSGRFPAEPYRERVQLTGKDDGPIQHVDLSHLSDEDLERLEGVLGPLLGGGEGGEGEAGAGG